MQTLLKVLLSVVFALAVINPIWAVNIPIHNGMPLDLATKAGYQTIKPTIYLPDIPSAGYYRFTTIENSVIQRIDRIHMFIVTYPRVIPDTELQAEGTEVNKFLKANNVNQINFNLINNILPHYDLQLMLQVWWTDTANAPHTTTYDVIRGNPANLAGQRVYLTTTPTHANLNITGLPPGVDLPTEHDPQVNVTQPINNPVDNPAELVYTNEFVDMEVLAALEYVNRQTQIDLQLVTYEANNGMGIEPGRYLDLMLRENGMVVTAPTINLAPYIPTTAQFRRGTMHQADDYAVLEFTHGYAMVITFNNTTPPGTYGWFYPIGEHDLGHGMTLYVYNENEVEVDNIIVNMARISISPDGERAAAISAMSNKLFVWGKNDKEQFGSSLPAEVSAPTEISNIEPDSKGSYLMKDVKEGKDGTYILMEDGQTIEDVGYNGGAANQLGLGNNVEYQPSLTKVNLSQLNFVPNEQLEEFATTNMNDDDQVALVSTFSRYLVWGRYLMDALTGVTPQWLLGGRQIKDYGTTSSSNYIVSFNKHTHKFDWIVCGDWVTLFNNAAGAGTPNTSNSNAEFIPCDRPYTMFSTSIYTNQMHI